MHFALRSLKLQFPKRRWDFSNRFTRRSSTIGIDLPLHHVSGRQAPRQCKETLLYQANSSKETHNVKLTNQSWCPLPYPQHASCLPTYQSPLPSLLQAERTVSHLFLSNQMIVVKSQDVDSWRI